MVRFGFGYDVHQLSEHRKMILGGVEIPFDKGFQGHSDADVLLHAVCDALLGAAALGDIGQHFPDTDPAYKNVSSIFLLKETANKIRNIFFEIVNIDSTIVLQQPKISAYIPSMRENIAHALSVQLHQVSVKATTSEHLGFIGREEGAAAFAVVSLQSIS
ncbi:MAG: 2-C-methyl-D-erythritol 2,4-cyclodiphosphate synthase [Ignavibacteriales bacterium]|nr:2-C-methyl-D-erythritol 2,4-cyclodiphosphate synthase [Ignavibacteriales bacterium]